MTIAHSDMRFEIRSVRVVIGHANYPRPAIIVHRLPDRSAWVHLLSTKDYSERGQSFCFDSRHPDFPFTGLAATSYTIHPHRLIPPIDIGPKCGELVGDLAKEFQAWLA